MKNNSLSEIAAFLKGQQQLTLLCHVRPDGDTLGSAFGLAHLLEKMGKEVQVLCTDQVSPRYQFLSGGKATLTGKIRGALCCIDIASPDMAGSFKEAALSADLVIDHHPTNPYYGKLNYIDPKAGATGEIMVALSEMLGGLDRFAAEAFYTAIATDTGCFKYGNTTRNTHLMAARLMETEADITTLNKWLFQTKSRAEFEINRLAMETIRYYADGAIVSMLISGEMQEKTGAGPDEMEAISALPIQMEGVVAAATFKETAPGYYKVSLRTTGILHGGNLCAHFGGGGHAMAAGCSMEGDYEVVEQKMIRHLTDEWERLS